MIRRARAEDWAAVQGLWREIDELHAALAPAYFRRADRPPHEWAQLVVAPDAAVFLAAPRGEPAAGAVSVRIYDTPPDPAMVPRRRGHVEMLVVAQAHRRRGIGRRLMEQASAWARQQGAVELVLTVWAGNSAAEAFYQRLGYSVLSRVLTAPLA